MTTSSIGSYYLPKVTQEPFKMVDLNVNQGYVELSKNGATIARVKCQNNNRSMLTGDLKFEGDCCYFTLIDPRERLRDHYCFNAYMNKFECMFSDEVVIPQPVKPQATFTLNNVAYGLHVDEGFVEISTNGASIKRLEVRKKEFTIFTGVTHVHEGCFYFLLCDEGDNWKKIGLFNPLTNYFAVLGGEIYRPYFAGNHLISVNPGCRFDGFVDVFYTYELLQGPDLLKKLEHRIGNRNVTLKDWEMKPFA